MQTQRYESLILTVPEITNDEATDLERTIEKKLQSVKGSLVAYDRWGKFLLAYQVKKNEYGIYFLARFDVPFEHKADVIKELKQLFDLKYNALVMRHVMCNIPSDAPLSYKRPQSLDEMPKDVDQFLKENKMGGFNQRRRSDRPEEVVTEKIDEQDVVGDAEKEESSEEGQ